MTVTFVEYKLCARHFIYTILLKPPKYPAKKMLLSPFCSWDWHIRWLRGHRSSASKWESQDLNLDPVVLPSMLTPGLKVVELFNDYKAVLLAWLRARNIGKLSGKFSWWQDRPCGCVTFVGSQTGPCTCLMLCCPSLKFLRFIQQKLCIFCLCWNMQIV